MALTVRPLVLEGYGVRLEPLTAEHAAALYSIGQQAEDWRYMPRSEFTSLADTRCWLEEAQALAELGEQIGFAIRDQVSGCLAGSTRLLNIRPAHRSLEIGYTWLGRDFQRSHVNTAAKFCLLRHAFDSLQALRVELKCDRRNERSQRAIARLGATREGVFRKHMVVREGYVRDSVYFSIIDDDWPPIAQHLQRSLQQQPTRGR